MSMRMLPKEFKLESDFNDSGTQSLKVAKKLGYVQASTNGEFLVEAQILCHLDSTSLLQIQSLVL